MYSKTEQLDLRYYWWNLSYAILLQLSKIKLKIVTSNPLIVNRKRLLNFRINVARSDSVRNSFHVTRSSNLQKEITINILSMFAEDFKRTKKAETQGRNNSVSVVGGSTGTSLIRMTGWSRMHHHPDGWKNHNCIADFNYTMLTRLQPVILTEHREDKRPNGWNNAWIQIDVIVERPCV